MEFLKALAVCLSFIAFMVAMFCFGSLICGC